jgi:hypothetical protein
MSKIGLDEDEYFDEEKEPETEHATIEDSEDDLSAFDNPLLEDLS